MANPSILVATWDAGLVCVTGTEVHRELAGQSVRSLASDRSGGVLAIVGAHALGRRSARGEWTTVAECEATLSSCVASAEAIFLGTDDARILRVDRDGTQHWLTAFDTVEGRDKWYAGTAIVDGRVVGPPLGVRSMTATCDGGAVLANVHVGGIARSGDGGSSWQPTIDIECDVHEVRAHPTRPEIVIAAAAVGLCASRDGGLTWSIERRGLHAPHCSGVAFGRHDILVSASTDPFAKEGAVYRRPIDGTGPLEPLGGGMPRWTDGKADTNCIATLDSMVAVIDLSGRLYVSQDDGASWSCADVRVPMPSALYIS
jgi:hypothetical protein